MKKTKNNSGRKPVVDKTIQVSFYTKESIVKKAGNMEKARAKAKELLEESVS